MGKIKQMPGVSARPTLECVHDHAQKLERIRKIDFGNDVLEGVVGLVPEVVEVVEGDQEDWSGSLVSKMITEDIDDMNWNFLRSGIRMMKKQNTIEIAK